MLLSKTVKIKWGGHLKPYWESLGYVFTKMGDTLEVRVEDLKPKSRNKVKVRCDECGKEKEIQWVYYMNNKTCRFFEEGEDYLCPSCRAKRAANSVEVKNKTKSTLIERYGVEKPIHIPGVQDKMKKTCLEKYGVEYSGQIPEQKEKVKQTFLSRYGVSSPFSVEEIREKAKKTLQKNYGVDSPQQSEEIRKRTQETNLLKYGKRFTSQVPEIQEKMRRTTQEHYGVDYSLASKEVREKAKVTMLEIYGVENAGQSSLIREKAQKTMLMNSTVRTSQQQRKIFDILSQHFEEVKLNFPCGKYSLDCYFKYKSSSFDVEYDGWYWHSLIEEQDKMRDEYVISQKIKIIRIRGGRELPLEETLLSAIEKVEEENLPFYELFLPEWIENCKK